jgi:hypothetical protein
MIYSLFFALEEKEIEKLVRKISLGRVKMQFKKDK